MTSCWIITEGMAGTENQCLGVAEALGVMPVIKRIGLKQPWKSLSPFLGFEQPFSFTGDTLDAPYPDLVLASGRKAIAAARYIKKASKGETFVVQIQDPRISPKHFDLVAVPHHDPTRGDNVVVTHAAPNRITDEKLKVAAQDFKDVLAPLPQPRVAVLIGGNSKAYKMTAEITRNLCADLLALAQSGYGLMVTASRRTGEENAAIINESLRHENIYVWDGQGENPYFAFLGTADFMIVTADSVSMISEAATTGKPVYMLPLDGGTPRFNKFHNHLLENGIIRTFDGSLKEYSYAPIRDAKLVAWEIKSRIGKPL